MKIVVSLFSISIFNNIYTNISGLHTSIIRMDGRIANNLNKEHARKTSFESDLQNIISQIALHRYFLGCTKVI